MQAYQLSINGDEVTFSIKQTGQAMAVGDLPTPDQPEGGRTASPESFLSAEARHDGKKVWAGMLPCDITSHVPISEQFSDSDLERLYRQKRAKGRK